MCSQVRVEPSYKHVPLFRRKRADTRATLIRLKFTFSYIINTESGPRKREREREGGGRRRKGEQNTGRLLTKFQYTVSHYPTSVCLASLRHSSCPVQSSYTSICLTALQGGGTTHSLSLSLSLSLSISDVFAR